MDATGACDVAKRPPLPGAVPYISRACWGALWRRVRLGRRRGSAAS